MDDFPDGVEHRVDNIHGIPQLGMSVMKIFKGLPGETEKFLALARPSVTHSAGHLKT
jgi:hypothetical protein